MILMNCNRFYTYFRRTKKHLSGSILNTSPSHKEHLQQTQVQNNHRSINQTCIIVKAKA